MLRMLATPREILFLHMKVDWEVLGDQLCPVASRKSHRCCTVSGRVRRVTSLTELGKEGESKTGCLSSQKKLIIPEASSSPNRGLL